MTRDTNADPTRDTEIRLAIEPAPTDEELAAIVGAMTALRRAALVALAESTDAPGEPAPSRWARAGRRDAMRGIDHEGDRLP